VNERVKQIVVDRVEEILIDQAQGKITEGGATEAMEQQQSAIVKGQQSINNNRQQQRPESLEIPDQQRSFNVSINMNTKGNRIIRNVVFHKRPPTNYDGAGQGPHIVAYSLMEATIRGQLIDSTLVPEDDTEGAVILKLEENKPDAIKGLEEILNALENLPPQPVFVRKRSTPVRKVTKGNIKDLLNNLKKTKNEVFILESNNNDQSEFKSQIRSKLSYLRQGVNIVAEDIIRLWNKRTNAVYLKKKSTVRVLTNVEIYGSGTDNRENTAVQASEELAAELELGGLTVESSEVDGTVEDNAQEEIESSENLTRDEIVKELSRLIDIKSEEEMTYESLRAQFPEPKPGNRKKDPLSDIRGVKMSDSDQESFFLKSEIKTEHGTYLNQAAKEAAALGKLAYPRALGEWDAEDLAAAIKTNMAAATIETFEKRIKNIDDKIKLKKNKKKKEKLEETKKIFEERREKLVWAVEEKKKQEKN